MCNIWHNFAQISGGKTLYSPSTWFMLVKALMISVETSSEEEMTPTFYGATYTYLMIQCSHPDAREGRHRLAFCIFKICRKL
jgi:hypothetical protein